MLLAKIPKKLFKDPKDVTGINKRAIQKRKNVCGVAEIPIANTFDELVEMDFVDYGDFATFLRIQGAFPRFPTIILWERKER